jgi:hypothetical protein
MCKGQERVTAAIKKKIRLTVSAEAERYVRRDAPVKARKMAATGAMPLPPIEMATVLFVLMNDADPEIKKTARHSLQNLPDSICDPVLVGATHPAVLGTMAHLYREQENRIEKIALNGATDDPTIAFLATLPSKRVIEIIGNNQERLMRSPAIVDALGDNALTGRATIERILTFLGVIDAANAEDDKFEQEELSEADAEAALLAILGSDAKDLAKQLAKEDSEMSEELKGSLSVLIAKMSVFHKIKLASMGNKEARGILIRDKNKIVAAAAIRSPKITDNEVEAFSKSRQLSDDVLRIISMNREWTKMYAVRYGLATNPKCPLPSAMKFLALLQEKDLRQIAKSKEVPGPIVGQAKRILAQRGKK